MLVIVVVVIIGVILAVTQIKNSGNQSATSDTKKLKKIVVAESARGLQGWLPTYVAKGLGYFEEEGLDVTFVTYNGGTVAIPAMLAGDAQFCQTGYDQVLKTYEAGQPTTIIMVNTTIHPWKLYGAKGINSVADLKGKVISGSLPGSSARAFVMACLKSGGLDPVNDVTYIQVSTGANLPALESGQIFACMGSANAEETRLKKDGYPVLVDLSDPETHKRVIHSDQFHLHMIHVTKTYAEENPETVQAFINATVKALTWMKQHKPLEIYQTVAEFFPMEKDMAEEILNLSLASMSFDGFATQSGHDAVVDWSLNMVHYISKPIALNDIYDGSYLETAWRQYGK